MDDTPLSRDGEVAAPPLPAGGATMALTVDPAMRARFVGMYVVDAATLQDGGRYTRLPVGPGSKFVLPPSRGGRPRILVAILKDAGRRLFAYRKVIWRVAGK